MAARLQARPNARAEALAAARRVERKLADGPRTRAELLEGIDGPRFAGASTRLNLVRIPPSGTWERRRADLYGLAEDWLGTRAVDLGGRGRRPADPPLSVGLRAGVAVSDVASWAGMQITPVKAALDRMDLRQFRDEQGGLLLDLPRAPLPAADMTRRRQRASYRPGTRRCS